MRKCSSKWYSILAQSACVGGLPQLAQAASRFDQVLTGLPCGDADQDILRRNTNSHSDKDFDDLATENASARPFSCLPVTLDLLWLLWLACWRMRAACCPAILHRVCPP